MKHTNFNTSNIFRFITVVFSKLMLCVLAVFSLMLFVAVAEGSVNLVIGLVLGLLVLFAANVFFGVILPVENDIPGAITVQPQPMRHTAHRSAAVVPLRVVHGGRAA